MVARVYDGNSFIEKVVNNDGSIYLFPHVSSAAVPCPNNNNNNVLR